jgi:transketolase
MSFVTKVFGLYLFFIFCRYALGAVTLSALSHLRVFYIFTHDSIGLGEDGPTHQPVEKFALCRSTPNLNFLRPGKKERKKERKKKGFSNLFVSGWK